MSLVLALVNGRLGSVNGMDEWYVMNITVPDTDVVLEVPVFRLLMFPCFFFFNAIGKLCL